MSLPGVPYYGILSMGWPQRQWIVVEEKGIEEEKGEQEKDETSKQDIVEEKDDIFEEDAKDVTRCQCVENQSSTWRERVSVGLCDYWGHT